MKVDYSALKVMILDEDESFSQLLALILKDLGVSVVESAHTPLGIDALLNTHHPDVFFIDFDLKAADQNGIAFAQQLREQGIECPFIFLTTHLKNYNPALIKKLQPATFMSRELSRVKLLQTLELVFLQQENTRLLQKLSHRPARVQTAVKTASHIEPSGSAKVQANQIFFKIGDNYKRMEIDQITYFYSDNKLTYARIGSRNYPTNVQLRVLEDMLLPTFLRCHKKYLVNVGKIDSIQIKDYKLSIENEMVAIGHAYRKSFFDHLHLLK